MGGDDEKKSEADIQKAQKQAADALQDEIDDLIFGRIKPERPKNLRDFIHEEMAKDKQGTATDESARDPVGNSSAKKP